MIYSALAAPAEAFEARAKSSRLFALEERMDMVCMVLLVIGRGMRTSGSFFSASSLLLSSLELSDTQVYEP